MAQSPLLTQTAILTKKRRDFESHLPFGGFGFIQGQGEGAGGSGVFSPAW